MNSKFFTFGSFVAFSVAAKLTNYDTSYWAHKLSEGSFWSTSAPSSVEMKKARYFEYAKVSGTRPPMLLSILMNKPVHPKGPDRSQGGRRDIPAGYQVLRDVGIHLRCPTLGGRQRRTEDMLDGCSAEHRGLGSLADTSIKTLHDGVLHTQSAFWAVVHNAHECVQSQIILPLVV